MPPSVILFSCDPRMQPHFEIGRGYDRFKAADEFAQRGALGLKLPASAARGEVRRSLHTRPVPQFKFVDFAPRVAAFFVSHNYTT